MSLANYLEKLVNDSILWVKVDMLLCLASKYYNNCLYQFKLVQTVQG